MMKSENNTLKKPPKDKDLAQITDFMRASAWAMPFLGLLGLVTGYVYRGAMGALLGVLAAIAISLVAGLLIVWLTNAIGSTASGLLFGKRRAVWTVREEVMGTLNQARFRRENAQYKEALDYINTVLARDSEFPEALILKAEIIWDGYQELEGAKRFLEKVLSLDIDDKIVYSRAELLYDQLVLTDSPAKSGARPSGLEIGLAYHQGSLFRQFTDQSGKRLSRTLENKSAVDWATIGIIVFGSISLLALLVLNLNLERLDTSIRAAGRTVTRVEQTARHHAEKIERIDTAIEKIATDISTMQRKMKNR